MCAAAPHRDGSDFTSAFSIPPECIIQCALHVYISISISSGGFVFASLSFPNFSLHPSLPLPQSVSMCLFLRVSADLSTCQLFLKIGPCAFLALSFLFLSFFSPLVLCCVLQSHTHTHIFPHIQTHTHSHTDDNKLILSHFVSSTSSRCLALSHSHNRTHTYCAKSTLLHKG